MTDKSFHPLEGGCDCGRVRYRLESPPMFVHCCHCRWCQRETGASFALNALIEADRVTLLKEAPELINTPSASGAGQLIARCPLCRIAVWSHYRSAGPFISFIRVGSLDDPDQLPPDIHIFTASKQPWVALPPGAAVMTEYYDRKQYWPTDSLQRYEALLPKINAYRAAKAEQAPI
ncbi:MAG: aldehyde-activating protein [Proteobacteria bacterium]|nr:MAG: aldehyde-activating protein [Pseudomonadota bacterium]